MHEEFADHRYNEGVSTWGSGGVGRGGGEGRGEEVGITIQATTYCYSSALAASPAVIHCLP